MKLFARQRRSGTKQWVEVTGPVPALLALGGQCGSAVRADCGSKKPVHVNLTDRQYQEAQEYAEFQEVQDGR